MALSAIIFDVDGTLIDSNREHVEAWHRALQEHGYDVSSDRLAVEIGKGGDKLVPSVLGDGLDRLHGKSLRTAQAREFVKMAESASLRPFPGVEDLLNQLARRGVRLAIATSSQKGVFETAQKSAGVDWSSYFDVIVTGDDSSESKPAPGLLQVAIRKLGISPAQCAMVGDTPYDADTARDAGAISLGFTCGGMNDEKILRATGMRQVYRDPADINAHLDEALRIASPGSAILTQGIIESLMREALEVAAIGLEKGEAPIGCVIARGDGTVVARAHNEMNATQSKIAHAEMIAFGRLAGKVPADARDLILACTLEPCVMCLGAAMEAAVDTIVHGLSAPADGGRLRVRPPVSSESQMPRMIGDILADESRVLFERFLKRGPAHPVQTEFVRSLLRQA